MDPRAPMGAVAPRIRKVQTSELSKGSSMVAAPTRGLGMDRAPPHEARQILRPRVRPSA